MPLSSTSLAPCTFAPTSSKPSAPSSSADNLPDCDGPSCCTAFCDLMLGDAQCAALEGTVCVPFFEENMAPPGYENVGVCVLG